MSMDSTCGINEFPSKVTQPVNALSSGEGEGREGGLEIIGMSSPTQNSPAPSPCEVDPDGRCEQAVLFNFSQES